MKYKRATQIAVLMIASFLAGSLTVFNYAWRWLHRPKEH